jgi:prophage regulatory protein
MTARTQRLASTTSPTDDVRCLKSDDSEQRISRLEFYHRRDLLVMLPISYTTIWRLIRTGSFPAPVALSPGRVAWPRDAVDAWMAARRPNAGEAA